jgi:Kef-type K+ transport system membrane component KefB
MGIQNELPLFTNLLILLVAARIFGEIVERFKQPAMIGEILAGIILGPSVLNAVVHTGAISVISDLGVFMMVIIAGLEMNVDDIMKSLKGRNIIISLSAFFLPLACGFGVGRLLEQETMTSLFIGLCVAITALPISIRVLMDLGKINTDVGQKILSVAIFDDVLALSVLGVMLNIQDSDMSVGAIAAAGGLSLLKLIALVAILGLTHMVIKKITRKDNYIERSLNKLISLLKGRETLFALFFVFILIFATFTETLGFHFIIGAFFASIFISGEFIGKENFKTIDKTTGNIAMGFLAPIFFASIGLEADILNITNLVLLAAIVVVSYVSKIGGGYMGSRMAGFGHHGALAIGIGVNGRGLMELVIANVAYKSGIISNEIFTILIIMGIVTTLTTPSMLKYAFRKVK